MNSLLNGLKVLDFSRMLPGPYATMILADMGAEILKIDNPNNPDMVTSFPPYIAGNSALDLILNRKKEVISLDLKQADNQKRILEMVSEYDVIVEQFRPGVMKKLGLGYETVAEINPSIIFCSISSYGQHSSRSGHDINYLAKSGIASLLGNPPRLPGVQLADMVGGMYAAIAILGAYINRLKNGEGKYIDISLTDCVATLGILKSAYFSAQEEIPEVGDDLLDGGTIYDFYRTADSQYLAIGSIEPKFQTALLQTLGISSPDENVLWKRDVKQKISEKIRLHSLKHWIKVFQDVDACVEPVVNIDEFLSQEARCIERIHTSTGDFSLLSHPVKYRDL